MSIIAIVLLFLILLFCVHCFSAYKVIRNKDFVILKNNIINNLIFLFCLVSLIISMRLFWNIGIYVDEANISPSELYGGDFWNLTSWFRLLFLFIACILSTINLVTAD